MSASDNLQPDQFLDLYHHTQPSHAAKIAEGKQFETVNRDGRVYFSNQPHGYYGGEYGPSAVHVRMASHEAQLNDSFRSGERFYTVNRERIRPEHILHVEPEAEAG